MKHVGTSKAFFVVTAGVLLETPIPALTRQSVYTSADFEQDVAHPESDETKFMRLRDEALAHARELMDPRHVNWVKLEFMWV